MSLAVLVCNCKAGARAYLGVEVDVVGADDGRVVEQRQDRPLELLGVERVLVGARVAAHQRVGLLDLPKEDVEEALALLAHLSLLVLAVDRRIGAELGALDEGEDDGLLQADERRSNIGQRYGRLLEEVLERRRALARRRRDRCSCVLCVFCGLHCRRLSPFAFSLHFL
jgi:hypothetical protein